MINKILPILTIPLLFGSLSYGKVELSPKQVINIGNGAEPRELDPAKATGHPEGQILDQIFEGLTALDPLTMATIPGVAESWTISDDGTKYSFKIRKDATWSNGAKLNAHDFAYSWERALNPNTASEYAYQLYYIKNGKEYNTGKLKDPKKLGFKVVDDYTFDVELTTATPFFLKLTAFRTLYPTPSFQIKKFPGQKWTKPENMVSNGPFQLAEWKINKHIKVVPNPHYWDKSKIKIKEAYFKPIEDVNTEEKSFFANRIQITASVPLPKIPKYNMEIAKNKGKYHPYQVSPYLGTYYYKFNTKKKPFDDKRVRRALALSIDRKLIVEKVTKGGQKPAITFVPDNTAGYTGPGQLPSSLTKESLAEAKRLLAEAGFKDGKGFPKIDLLYNTSEAHKVIAVAIQNMWKKNLGIKVGLFNQEWKVYLNNTKNGNYQIARAGWIGDYPDPNTFLDMWITGGGHNDTSWSNKKYDELISKATTTTDNSVRYKYFTEAEKILMDELPILPIYQYTKTVLIKDKIKYVDQNSKIIDYKSNIMDRLFLKHFAMVK